VRAALLLIPFTAFAVSVVAAGAQNQDAAEAANQAAQKAAEAAEAAANAAEGTEPAHPAWMAGRMWLLAGEADDGSVWYFEGHDSDFGRSPFRVVLRTDDTPNPRRAHNNTQRLADIDCAGHRYRILRTTHYDDAGRAAEADERGDGRLVPVTSGTIFQSVEETVCSYARNPAESSGTAM
jgi:hypothetical protein